MKKILSAITAAVLILTFQNHFCEASDNNVKFTFAPKDKMVMLERVKAVNEEIVNGIVIQKQESLVSTKILYTQIKKGFELKAEITKIDFFINGEKTPNPVFEVLMECPIVYEIDNFGMLSDVKGYDKFKNLLYENFTLEFADEISKIFDENVMKEKAEFDWNQKTGNYAGKNVFHKEKWVNKEKLQIPGGNKIEVDVETVFFLKQNFKGKDCVKIVISYNGSNKDDNKLEGSAVIFVNPLNMDIYSISTEKNMTFKAGKEKKVLREKREYNYEYIF
ncbi:MAG: hypothetical protein H6681_00285 [Desulfobacteraceae bacterium]|nr:hypothetical protein [Desulfobacteraceae bacterium]